MGLVQIAAPATEPVTLAEARLQVKADDSVTADDTLITAQIVAARQLAENETGRSLITQTWRLTLDEFPDGPIRLERPPLISVESVQYVDTNGVTQTMSASDYIVDTTHVHGEIALAYNESWPDTRDQRNAVTVNFTTGYGDASAVPGAIKAAILLTIGDLYANRETSIVGTIRTENPAAKALLAPYCLRTFA